MNWNPAEIAANISRYVFSIHIAGYLDIAVMAFLLYQALVLLRTTRAASLLKGLLMFFAALLLSTLFNLHA